jgi:Dolichyl-phosphate-mannose-protein mannosyltransferase
MSGHLAINLESGFGLAVVLLLLWRSGAGRESALQPVLQPAFQPRLRLDLSDAFPMVLIALMIGAAFWSASRISFLSDDYVQVSMARAFSGTYQALFTQGGGDGFFRPLGYLSLAWTWRWAELDPNRWHFAGLLLHLANSLLVYVLAGAIGLSRGSSWLASALFAWHGANPEAVVWIAGRFDLLATFFGLLALIAFIKLWEESSIGWGVVSGVALGLGLVSKESAYAVPLAMLVYAAFRPGSWSRRIRTLAPFFLLAAAMFAYRWTLQGGIGGYLGPGGKPQALSPNLLSIVKALALRLWAVLFFPINWSIGVRLSLISMIFLYAAAWLALVLAIRGGRERLLLPLGFVVVMALPPVQQLLIGADLEKARLVYLPSAGFSLLAASAVTMVERKLRWFAGFAMLAFSFAALEHNLGGWETAAAKSKTVCEAVALCSNPASIQGLPRSLNGVYFFANGLPECVRIQREKQPDAPLHACSLAWDAATGSLGSTR